MSDNREIAIKLNNVKKMYRLGQIGGGTLQADLQSWWARKRGKVDPNVKIGQEDRARLVGQTFMALNGIDLTIYKGEAVGIIGSNGAGKSTMLKLLSRVTAPTSGEIDIYGRITSMLEVGTGFNGEMTGRENVYLNGAILGMTKAEIDAKMEQIIEFSEVRDFIDTPVKRYSSGMYVKLAFSVAAHLDSEIMIMDEVLAVGDMAFQKKCLDKMRDAATTDGKTVLYVSHNMNTIRQLCDRCVVLDKGKVIFDGDVEEAISIYLGTHKEMAQEREYNINSHGSWYTPSVLLEKTILKNDYERIYCGDIIEFDVHFKALHSLHDLRMRLVLLDENGVILAMCNSNNVFSTEEGKKGIVKLYFDTDILSSGKYSFRFSMFELDTFGNHNYVCVVNDFYDFVVNDKSERNYGMNWDIKSWGHFALPDFSFEVI